MSLPNAWGLFRFSWDFETKVMTLQCLECTLTIQLILSSGSEVFLLVVSKTWRVLGRNMLHTTVCRDFRTWGF